MPVSLQDRQGSVPISEFVADVIAGLSASPRTLPCKYLYDARGSELFEAICQTEDYYVTRADLDLHQTHLREIAQLIDSDAHVIELGSGAGVKTQLLLGALSQPRAYTPIEISESALRASVEALASRFPRLNIVPLRADYTQKIEPADLRLDPPARRRVVYFPGSTIGNFTTAEAEQFLMRMKQIAQAQGLLLIGVDLIKPRERLLRAYDDRHGITAQFNKNLLLRIKSELDARVDLDAFQHEARFNEARCRIEMHLVATQSTSIELAGHNFHISSGETIHTESSHKYSVESFQSLARDAGLTPIHCWLDSEQQFSMHCLQT